MIDRQSLLAAGIVCATLAVCGVRGEEPERAPSEELRLYLQGRYVYERQCLDCHGERGRGDGPWSEGLTSRPRNFRSGVFKFRTTPFGKLPVKADLERTIRAGISGTAMPTFTNLGNQDLEAVIYYITRLSRAWKDESLRAEPVQLPTTLPDWFAHQEEKEKHVERGSALFGASCALCHGEGGHGDGPAAGGLVDFWGHAVSPAALSTEHHKGGDSPFDLYRTIATGLNGTPMMGYADILGKEQIWDLVAWIESIEGTAPGEPN